MAHHPSMQLGVLAWLAWLGRLELLAWDAWLGRFGLLGHGLAIQAMTPAAGWDLVASNPDGQG